MSALILERHNKGLGEYLMAQIPAPSGPGDNRIKIVGFKKDFRANKGGLSCATV